MFKNKDIDNYILNKLDDKDLYNIRLVSKYFNILISKDSFWMNRILFKFPKLSIDIINKYKKKSSWLEYYKILNKIDIIYIDDYSLHGRLDYVIVSLYKGANIHLYNDSAIRFASEMGYLGIVKYLVENGANIHAFNDYALRWASQNGHLDVVKYLIKNGADVHINDDEPIKWAHQNNCLEVVKYLESLSK